MNYDFSFTALTHYVSRIKTFLEIKTKQCFGVCIYIYTHITRKKGTSNELALSSILEKIYFQTDK